MHEPVPTSRPTTPAASTAGALADAALAAQERRARVDGLCAEGRRLRHWDPKHQNELAERAFELACQPDSNGTTYEIGMAAALSLRAQYSVSVGAWQAALSQTAQAFALRVGTHPDIVTCDLHESAGWAHYYTGDYVEALEHLTSALNTARTIGARSSEAYALERLAAVQGATESADVAIATHLRALDLHRELGDRFGEGLALNNMAYTYADLGDLDSALASAQAALAFADSANWPYLLMGALDTVAYVYLQLGDPDEAEHFTRRNLELAHERNSTVDEINAMLSLGALQTRRSQWDDAAESVKRASALAEERGQVVDQYRCLKLLSEIEESRGDLKAALAAYKAYHDLRQTRVSGDAESRLANLRIEHEVDSARKDAEIARLRSIALEREVEQRRIAHAELEAQASLDPLTRLYNRRHLELLSQTLAHALAEGRPVSLIMFDVDRFKDINDRHGHVAGDAVLVRVAELLVANSRETDTPCRYGGDEFLVLLPDMDLSAAESAAERLHAAVSDTCIVWADNEVCVTISAGVATAVPAATETLDSLIERADRALYRAKHEGRDRVVLAPVG